MRKSTDVEHFSILSKIHKRTKDSEYFKVFPIFLLTASIVANKVPVYCYHLQVYAFVHIIKIIGYVAKLWFVVKICHFVGPTQTSILAASIRTWRGVYRLHCYEVSPPPYDKTYFSTLEWFWHTKHHLVFSFQMKWNFWQNSHIFPVVIVESILYMKQVNRENYSWIMWKRNITTGP